MFFYKIWKLKEDLIIKEVEEKVYIFRFGNWVEKERVLFQQPWSFNKALMVIREFDGKYTADSIELSWCPFWVQIHGIPLGMMNENVARAIGSFIRQILVIDKGGDKVVWGHYLRVRILINVMKPLKRGTKVKSSGGEQVLVAFKYERLPDICFVCGRLDH